MGERLPFRVEVSPIVPPGTVYVIDPSAISPSLLLDEDDLRKQIWTSSNEQAEQITDALRRHGKLVVGSEESRACEWEDSSNGD